MSYTDIRATAARWRKALRDEDDENEKRSTLSVNVRLLLVCAGTLLLILLVLSGARQASASHLARVYADSNDSGLLEDISNQTLGVSRTSISPLDVSGS